MKSKRRHDLETNELAKRLSAWGDQVRPYSKAITVATVAIVCVVVVWLVYSRFAAAQRQRAWDVYTYAMTSASPDWDALQEAAAENPGTPMGDLAGITWADAELQQATQTYFTDEAASQQHLENAMEGYRRLIDGADDEGIKNRARLGMARALETEGKVGKAIEFYQSVEGPFAGMAAERAKQLSRDSTRDAIAWLATAEVPDFQAPIGPGTPGLRPPFDPSEFNLDPQIPSQTPGSLTGPIMPGAATDGGADSDISVPPLEFENPFTGPSDPDRYAEPPAEEDGQTAPPTDTDESAGAPADDAPNESDAGETDPEDGE